MILCTRITMYSFILLLLLSCVSQGNETRGEKQTPPKNIQIQDFKKNTDKPSDEEKRKYVIGEILVKFKSGTTVKIIHFIQTELNLKTIRIINKPYLYLMKMPHHISVMEAMASLKKYKEVEYAEPNDVTTLP